jgi:hypothetical protein
MGPDVAMGPAVPTGDPDAAAPSRSASGAALGPVVGVAVGGKVGDVVGAGMVGEGDAAGSGADSPTSGSHP